MSKKKEVKKITLGLVVSWIFGIIFAISGISFIFQGAIKSGTALILACLILLPPVNRLIEKEFNFEISRGLKIVAVIVLFIVYAYTLPGDKFSRQTSIDAGESLEEELRKISEPVKAPTVEIISYNDKTSSSYLYITGEVKNTGTTTAKFVKVTAKFYKDDKFIDRAYTYVDNLDIPPGEIDTFQIMWGLQDVDSYKLTVTSS